MGDFVVNCGNVNVKDTNECCTASTFICTFVFDKSKSHEGLPTLIIIKLQQERRFCKDLQTCFPKKISLFLIIYKTS